MARLFSVTTGSTALVAATAKVAIQLATGSGVTNAGVQLDVTFNGSTATATPVLCEIVRTTGASSGGSTFTPLKIGQAQDMAAGTTARINDTSDGSSPTILLAYFIPPTSGVTWQVPLGRESFSMINSQFLELRLTAPAVVSYVANWIFEE